MRIAVVGSAGYLGTALVPRLVASDVLRIDAGLWGDPAPGVEVLSSGPEILARVRQCKPNAVVWLAALAHDPHGKLDAQLVEDVNATLPASVAQWCFREGRRFVTVSSYSVFAGPGAGAYPESKRRLENLLGDLYLHRGISYVRLGTLFGVTPDSKVESFRPHLLLNSFVLDALAHGEVRVLDSARLRPVCPIEWAVSGILNLLDADQPPAVHNIHICSGYLKDFARFVSDMLGAKIVKLEGANPDLRSYAYPPELDDKVAREMLRYELEPLVSFTKTNLKTLVRQRDASWATYYQRAGALRVF